MWPFVCMHGFVLEQRRDVVILVFPVRLSSIIPSEFLSFSPLEFFFFFFSFILHFLYDFQFRQISSVSTSVNVHTSWIVGNICETHRLQIGFIEMRPENRFYGWKKMGVFRLNSFFFLYLCFLLIRGINSFCKFVVNVVPSNKLKMLIYDKFIIYHLIIMQINLLSQTCTSFL